MKRRTIRNFTKIGATPFFPAVLAIFIIISTGTITAPATAGVGPVLVSPDGRFQKTHNGVVRDTKTRLEWYAGPNMNVGCGWTQNWINGLDVGGGGWRAPSLPELRSLYSKETESGFATTFLNPKGWYVWSSCRGYVQFVKAFDFKRGRIISEPNGIDSSRSRALAVRKPTPQRWHEGQSTVAGNQLAVMKTVVTENTTATDSGSTIIATDGRFKKTNRGVVQDTRTGLEWYTGLNTNVGCISARSWIRSLVVDGGGWRFPSLKELRSLYSKENESGFVTNLLNPNGWYVWSACDDSFNPSSKAFDFRRGRRLTDRNALDSTRSRALAVRDPKKRAQE